MTGLPQGWAIARLDEVTTPRGEKADPATLGELPFLGMDHIEANTANLLGSQPVGELKSAVAVFKSGDLLYGRLRPYLNKVHLAGFDGAASAEFIVFPPQPAIEQRYLQCILRSPEYRAIADQRSTGDRPRVKFEDVGDYEIPLPPLPEQRRIVRKLDTLSARSTTALTHLAAIEKLVERYKASVTAFAVTGALTQSFRRLNSLPEPTVTTFGEWFDYKGGSQPPKSTFYREPAQGRIRLLQIRDFASDDKAVYIDDNGKWPRCSSDDIMVGRYGASVGKILSGKAGAYNVALVKWVFDRTAFDPAWVYALLKSDVFQRPIAAVSRSAQDGFNKGDVENIEFLKPSITEQREIVRRIETAFAKIDRLAAEAAKALKLLGHLDQRILAKAFAGDLVPQDPTDEPAESLLNRIRDARATAPKARRGRK